MNNIDLSGVESSLDAIANSQGNINSASSFLIAVLTSIVTFIACELLKYFLFEPHIRYKKVKEKTAYCIRLYYPYYSKPMKITTDNEHTHQAQNYIMAQEEIRRCATELMSFADLLPNKYLCVVPKKQELYAASNRLSVLSLKTIDSVWKRLENQEKLYWDLYGDEPVDVLVSNIKKSLKISSCNIEEK